VPVSLSKVYRKLLENTTKAARVLAESACRAALENLAVHEGSFRAHMSEHQRLLRNRLRARGRALGDVRDLRTGTQDIRHLGEHAAYEHWHRLLFTRFLTENNLLYTDEANDHVPVTPEECEELAPALGARDGLDLACRFASRTLPGVFRRDDPVLDLPVALNDQVELRRLLARLPSECFLADDALGWTYQFWQAQRKDEINSSGKKIGADEVAPVTQLFTEDYMVEFLLHNTIGAWWAGKLGPIQAATEAEARARAALPGRDGLPAISWTYLRFVEDEVTKTWLPAAGTFDGWPKAARLLRLLDPCMGSGHFLVFALPLLARLRMVEEKHTAQAAVVAVLKDNIHGLELDERCTQIAAFNVALTAWKLAGYQTLPSLNLACSGLAPTAAEEDWVALAGDNSRARNGMARLYRLFADAPAVGSLINPHRLDRNLIEADFHELVPLLNAAFAPSGSQISTADSDGVELTVIAQGLAKAAELLAGHFTLVSTNVPYLKRGNQDEPLLSYCKQMFPTSCTCLSTTFIERCLEFCSNQSTFAAVTPQLWLFLQSYQGIRKTILTDHNWNLVARLGHSAFGTISGHVVDVVLVVVTRNGVRNDGRFVDCDQETSVSEKAAHLTFGELKPFDRAVQLNHQESRIVFGELESGELVNAYARSLHGQNSFDDPSFVHQFWELPCVDNGWTFQQTSSNSTGLDAGLENIFLWEHGSGRLAELMAIKANEGYTTGAWRAGKSAWGKAGIAVSGMGNLYINRYSGESFDTNVAVIFCSDDDIFLPLWCYCTSASFVENVRKIDRKPKVTPNTYAKVPFDLPYWQEVAAERFPVGLPKPHSDDPTQWLFNGYPAGSAQQLHVAVARLLGYLWPRQTGSSFRDCPALEPDGLESFSDEDGIVCLPPINREQPASTRLRQLLTAALGTFDERTLISTAGPKGSKSKTLEDWLRDEFFEQHAKLFHDRPFIWHLWDGRPDGFHVLVNYHRLDHAMLQKLTYSYLGNWIQQQAEDAKADKPGAAARLGAARSLQSKLAAILEGEAPLDIFVRWKPLKDQAQGWHPDLDDGIRQNIRPFLLAGDVGKKGAGLFRAVPLALNDKDRGTEPHRRKDEYPWFWSEKEPGTDPTGGNEFVGNRWNNVHLTLARKRQARA
jgi:hypothetical protein